MENIYSKHFITYGDSGYNIQKKRLAYEAKAMKIFSSINVYSNNSLSDNFKEDFDAVLSQKKGGGYWMWKSYIILDMLNKTSPNDILFYLDAGSTLNIKGLKRMVEYFETLNKSNSSFLRFDNKQIEKYWTTKEVFDYFEIKINSEIGNSFQLAGGIMFVKNTKEAKDFFIEFQNTVRSDNKLLTDFYSLNQITNFQHSRHDQSIYSILGKKYNSIILSDETYFEINSNTQYEYPILVVRDWNYSSWQKFKFYSNYFNNLKKPIYFTNKPPYYKNISLYKKVKNKIIKYLGN